MTVRLLKPYAQRPVGAIATFDASTEAGMIEAKQASADLTGGFEYFLPRPGLKLQVAQIAVGSLSLRAAEQAPALLPEGQVLYVSGGMGAVGKVHRLDPAGGNMPLQSWTVGTGALAPIGGYAGEQRFLVTCSAGSVEAGVQNAALGAAQLSTDGSGVAGVSLPSGIASAWWKKSYRSQMGLGDSVMAQGAHMPHTPPNRPTRDLFPAFTNLNASSNLFVILVEAGPTTIAGNGTMKFYASDSTMTWTAFGDAEGPRVVVDATKCFYALESATAGNTIYIGVVPRKKPNSDRSDTVNVTGAFRLRNNCGTFGQFAWTAALMATPFDISYAFAIPSIRASDWWDARSQWQGVYTDLTYINLGTNGATDLAGAIQEAIAVENIAKLRQGIGSLVVICGLLPYTAAPAGVNAAMMHLNGLLRAAARRLNCDFIDPFPYFVDPVGTGGYIAGMTGDGLHPSALCGYVWASKCNVPVLSKYARNTDQRSFAGIVYNATTAPYGNLLPNGVLKGITGTPQAGATGEVPDSWTLVRESGSTVTANSVAPQSANPIPRSDGKPGYYWRIAISNNNAGNVAGEGYRMRLAAFIATNHAVGDYIVFEGDLRISGTGIQSLEVGWTSEGKSCQALSTYSAAGYGMGNLNGDTVSLPFRSPPMLIESISQGLMPAIIATLQSGGTCVLDIGQTLNLHKVPAP